MKEPGSSPLIPPGYKLTEVGVIPEEWEVKYLRDVAQIRSGIAKNANSSVADPVVVHYLRVANVQDGFLDLSDMSQLEVSRSDLQRFSVLPGDVLMNEGGDRDKLGRGSIWKGQFQPCVHQNHVFVVRCGRSVLPEYLAIWSAFSTARKFFLLAGKQTTNLASINKTSLGELPVPLPRENEQRSIATALSDVDALLSGLDRLIAKKRDLKQAAMQQLLTGQTRLPGFHGEWEVKRLWEVAEIVMGQSPSSTNYNRQGEGLPLIQGNADVLNRETIKRVFTKQVTKRGRIGDILMSVRAPVGEVSRATFDVCLGRGVCAIRYPNDFLYHYLIFLEPTWAKHSKGSTFDSVNSTDVKAVEIKLPSSLPEQTAIAAVLSDMDAELAALEARRAKTSDLKQAMMQELLTGRTRLV